MSKTKMQASQKKELAASRFEHGKALLIAGLRGHFSAETAREIPSLWQRYVPYIGRVSNRLRGPNYGVCWSADENGFEYLAGMEGSAENGLPKEFSVVRIPPCEAIFRCLAGSGYRQVISASEAPASSNAIMRNSIRRRAWVAWKFGFLCSNSIAI